VQLTFDQIHAYFEAKLDRRLPTKDKVAVKCPFHDDRTASATVFLNGNGGFNCQTCSAKGNLFQFEALLSGCGLDQARVNVSQLTGAKMDSGGPVGPCTAIYDYRNANGSLAFQKRRYEPPGGKKTFRIYRPDGRGGWLSGFDGEPETKKVLFNLPALVTCNLAIICEGEKDCQTVEGINIFPDSDIRIATTTNFEGAWQQGHSPKWLDSYSPYFTGKHVVILEDNDESGRTYAEYISHEVYRFADSVRRIAFPELPEKGDVTDWMQTHTKEDLAAIIRRAPKWHPSTESTAEPRKVFVNAAEFADSSEEKIDWLIEKVLQRGANGFFCAPPKGAKSWVSLDMLLSLALGCPWLDFIVPRPVKCGLVTREDNPVLTAWRLKKLFQAKRCTNPGLLEDNLYINSRAQTPRFFLDDPQDVNELISDIKRLKLELVLLDVFNVIHSADENDNTEMVKILAQVRRIQDESGSAIGIIHHFGKGTSGSMTQRLRGASAIAGFAEWLIGLSVADEEKKVRMMEFELKADQPPDPIFFRIESDQLAGFSRINRVAYEPPINNSKTLRFGS
jgi:hypothetical protein